MKEGVEIFEQEPGKENQFREDLFAMLRTINEILLAVTGYEYMSLPEATKPNPTELKEVCDRLQKSLDQEDIKQKYTNFFLVGIRNQIEIVRLSLLFQEKNWCEEYENKQREVLKQVVENVCEAVFGERSFPETQSLDQMRTEAHAVLDADTEYPTDSSLSIQERVLQWRTKQPSVKIEDEEYYSPIYEYLYAKIKESAQKWGVEGEVLEKVTLKVIYDSQKPFSGLSSYDNSTNTLLFTIGNRKPSNHAEATLLIAHELFPGHGLDSLIQTSVIQKGIIQPEEQYDGLLGSPTTVFLEGVALTQAMRWTNEDGEKLSFTKKQVHIAEVGPRTVHRLRYEMLKSYIEGGMEKVMSLKESFAGFFTEAFLNTQITFFEQSLKEGDEKNPNYILLFYYTLYYLGIEKIRQLGFDDQRMRALLYSSTE